MNHYYFHIKPNQTGEWEGESLLRMLQNSRKAVVQLNVWVLYSSGITIVEIVLIIARFDAIL